MPRLSNENRNRALGMIEGGMNHRQVALHFKCTQSTISRLVARHKDTGSVDDRPRPGAKRATDEEQDRLILETHKRHKDLPATVIAKNTPGIFRPNISSSTVRRRLKDMRKRVRKAKAKTSGAKLPAKQLKPKTTDKVIRPEDIELLWGDSSPCCWSVLITLEEKQIRGYRNKKLSFEKHEYRSPEVKVLNPRAELPSCKIGKIVINESLALCHYISEKNQGIGCELIPKNLETKGLMWQRLCEFYWNFPRKAYKNYLSYLWSTPPQLQDKSFLEQSKQAFAQELNLWESYLRQSNENGPYLIGKQFTLADVIAFPWFAYFIECGLNVADKYPYLDRYYKFLKERPSIVKTWLDFQERPNRYDNLLEHFNTDQQSYTYLYPLTNVTYGFGLVSPMAQHPQ